ncbi:hypothetical protein ACFQ6U_18890 [Streptomyces sp. NPDC056465]|uniref:hypothetical protein n=1 Tax=Streptomyces sp. NPDC056465 TaxID=3345829 RepID=UPI00368B06D6
MALLDGGTVRAYQQELPGLEIKEIRLPEPLAGATIQERFEAFHELNPWVLDELEAMTARCVGQQWPRVGIAMLFELLRWRYGEATRGDEFRLNNSYRSRYVRLLLERHPEWVRLFSTRALRTD